LRLVVIVVIFVARFAPIVPPAAVAMSAGGGFSRFFTSPTLKARVGFSR